VPKIDLAAIPAQRGSDYPPPHDAPVAARVVRTLSAAFGFTDLVVNHVVVPPGSWSSQRHWHAGEDELAVVLSGEGVLVDDGGRHPMRAGDVALFRQGDGNGHHLVNESGADLVLLAVSPPERSPVHYPDIGTRIDPGGEMRADT
jgi:uncharacterized cupin superfamily protein